MLKVTDIEGITIYINPDNVISVSKTTYTKNYEEYFGSKIEVVFGPPYIVKESPRTVISSVCKYVE